MATEQQIIYVTKFVTTMMEAYQILNNPDANLNELKGLFKGLNFAFYLFKKKFLLADKWKETKSYGKVFTALFFLVKKTKN